MEARRINKLTPISESDKNEIISGLIRAGVDRKTIAGILDPKTKDCPPTCSTSAENCWHCAGCAGYSAGIDIDALAKINKELSVKGVNISKINPVMKKFVK